jgi:hypothetical protein
LKTVDYKVQGGKMLKIKLVLSEQVIDSITILGDFFLHPESTIEAIEDKLRGCRIDRNLITSEIQDVLNKHNAVIIGATASDIAKAIEKASHSAQ